MDFSDKIKKFCVTTICSAFSSSVNDDFYFDGEMHDFWEMVYVKKGSMMVSEDDRIYKLNSKQAVFHKPMEFHRIWLEENQTSEYMIISFHCEENQLIDILGNGVFTFNTYFSQMLNETYESIVSNFDCSYIPLKSYENNSLKTSLSCAKLELFLLSVTNEVTPLNEINESVGAKNYKKIIDVMKNHIDENLTADELSDMCFFSTSTLKKTFRKYAGCGVMQYFNQLRIVRACSLLKGGMSVSEVSEKMSFSSPNYFSTFFKREMGFLPSKYTTPEKFIFR